MLHNERVKLTTKPQLYQSPDIDLQPGTSYVSATPLPLWTHSHSHMHTVYLQTMSTNELIKSFWTRLIKSCPFLQKAGANQVF